MSKAIYVAATCFQLITDLNIRCNMQGPAGDLIINAESVPDAHDLAERLKKYNIFDNIFIFKGYDSSFKSVFNGKNTIYSYLKLVVSKHWGKVNLNDFLEGKKEINLSDYEEGFCFNKRYCDIFRAYGIKINIIDEGLGSYFAQRISNIDKVSKIYLYNPEISDYYNSVKNKIVRVKLLDHKKTTFKKMLNDIFRYNETPISNGTIIFLDQPCLKTPSYIKKMCDVFPVLAKLKGYKKYFYEERVFSFIKEDIVNLSKNKKIFIKTHPRDNQWQIDFYKSLKIETFENNNLPWEIILLNMLDYKFYLISFSSTALLSSSLYFNNMEPTCTSILIYKRFINKNLDVKLQGYDKLETLVSKLDGFNKNIFIPENIEEFHKLI